jgi:hypothetical protein
MELAGRALSAALRNSSKGELEVLGLDDRRRQDRMLQLVRLGGLLHDVGHPPFSHGPEGLLPVINSEPLSHEQLTVQILQESNLQDVLHEDELAAEAIEPIIDIAVGSGYRTIKSQAVRLLADLVTGAVGVDRMDYLLRDSLFTGVGYGRFDVDRLIASLEIARSEEMGGPVWAIPEAALYDAEQMLLARWFMHLQVYNHKTRRVLDHHLREFLTHWLLDGRFPSATGAYLALDDHDVLRAARDSDRDEARALLGREHLRLVRAFAGGHGSDPDSIKGVIEQLRDEVASVWYDEFTVNMLKDGDGELWVKGSGWLRPLSQVSEVVASLQPRWIGRVYCKSSERQRLTDRLSKIFHEPMGGTPDE